MCEALNVAGPVRKVVLVAEVKGVLTAYVERFVNADELAAVASAVAAADRCHVVEVKGVEVDDRGNVKVTQ